MFRPLDTLMKHILHDSLMIELFNHFDTLQLTVSFRMKLTLIAIMSANVKYEMMYSAHVVIAAPTAAVVFIGN